MNKAKLSRRAIFAGMMATGLAGCAGLPRIGPNRGELLSGTTAGDGDTYIIPVNEDVAAYVDRERRYGFPSSFRQAGRLRSDVIQAGDALTITIWENVDIGLFPGEGPAVLDRVQVGADGFIFVPYAGRIRASGNSPEAIRRVIQSRLQDQTPDPQVEVRRAAGEDSVVIVTGDVGAQAVVPLSGATSRLSGVIASAGGAGDRPEVVRVTVVRGSSRGTVWYSDLLRSSANDIAMRAGDRVILELDRRAFIALGATGGQTLVEFPIARVTALEAIAIVGGLNANTADATGVFVLREEDETLLANMARETPRSNRAMYVIDLLAPNGLFVAQSFQIQDRDIVYVTEAPITQWNRTISTITGTLSSSAQLGTTVGAVTGN